MGDEVYVRFYEELNDFLAPDRRKRLFSYSLETELSVGQLLQELGVPLAQVDMVLLNGVAVDFARQLSGGDRLSVFPVFERLDIAAVQRLRKAPLRRTRFRAGPELEPLVRYLRLLGFDTWTHPAPPGDRISRIMLVREADLPLAPDVTRMHVVRQQRPRDQMHAVLMELDLYRSVQPLTRCISCNSLLAAGQCPQCGRRLSGSRVRRLERLVSLICR
jgi:uncharacterized protein with PIN domain